MGVENNGSRIRIPNKAIDINTTYCLLVRRIPAPRSPSPARDDNRARHRPNPHAPGNEATIAALISEEYTMSDGFRDQPMGIKITANIAAPANDKLKRAVHRTRQSRTDVNSRGAYISPRVTANTPRMKPTMPTTCSDCIAASSAGDSNSGFFKYQAPRATLTPKKTIPLHTKSQIHSRNFAGIRFGPLAKKKPVRDHAAEQPHSEQTPSGPTSARS